MMVNNPNYNTLCNLAGTDDQGAAIDQNIFVTLGIHTIRVSRLEWIRRGTSGPSRVHNVVITRDNFFSSPSKVTVGEEAHTGGCYVDELSFAVYKQIKKQHPDLLETMLERICRLETAKGEGEHIPLTTAAYWSEAAWVEDPWRHTKADVKHEYVNGRTLDLLYDHVCKGMYGGASHKNKDEEGNPRMHKGEFHVWSFLLYYTACAPCSESNLSISYSIRR